MHAANVQSKLSIHSADSAKPQLPASKDIFQKKLDQKQPKTVCFIKSFGTGFMG